MQGIGELFWIFLMLAALQPVLKQKLLEAGRIRVMRALEERRKSRVICLVHRQESMGFLGFPLLRFIDIEDSEEILRAIRLTDDDVPIDLVLHTPGGLVLASEQIARALRSHPAKVTVFVPHYAMSGGTMLALGANEIVLDPCAVLGPVDPQIQGKPAASILRAVERKPTAEVDDDSLILADVARMALDQQRALVTELLLEVMDRDRAAAVAERLSQGHFTHDHPIGFDEAKALGLPVAVGLPPEVYELMELHPQPKPGRSGVSYLREQG